jgi:uncharacterized membrane protein
MPFCTTCGTEVDAAAAYCRNCGSPQQQSRAWAPPPPPRRHSTDPLSQISDRTACLLCYIPVVGILPAIICLAAQKYRTNYRVRFHSFQGLYIFVAWLIASSISSGPPFTGFDHLGHVARLLVFICWIYMLVRVSQDLDASLPIIGDLAARSTHEQL